jgi:hypothetical protein
MAHALLGSRYQGMLPAGDVSHLSPTIRAAHHTSIVDFLGVNRGVVQGSNKKTFDTRSHYFTTWIAAGGYDLDAAKMIVPTDFNRHPWGSLPL